MNRMTQIAMLLVVLNAGRKDEIISGRWAEIDLNAAIWSIPGSRMKAGHDHVVPLSTQAVALLRELRAMVPVGLEHLFPNRRDHRRPMANRSLNAVLDRMRLGGEATVHGFRSAFSTKFNGEGENADVIEACLAHVHGNAVRRTYNKADYMPQRRELLQRWADYLDTQREGGAGDGACRGCVTSAVAAARPPPGALPIPCMIDELWHGMEPAMDQLTARRLSGEARLALVFSQTLS